MGTESSSTPRSLSKQACRSFSVRPGTVVVSSGSSIPVLCAACVCMHVPPTVNHLRVRRDHR